MVRNVRDLVTGVWTGEGEWRKRGGRGGGVREAGRNLVFMSLLMV